VEAVELDPQRLGQPVASLVGLGEEDVGVEVEEARGGVDLGRQVGGHRARFLERAGDVVVLPELVEVPCSEQPAGGVRGNVEPVVQAQRQRGRAAFAVVHVERDPHGGRRQQMSGLERFARRRHATGTAKPEARTPPFPQVRMHE